MFYLVYFTVSFFFVASGGPFPASGQHVETLQATLQAADKAWTQQGPAGRGEHTNVQQSLCVAHLGVANQNFLRSCLSCTSPVTTSYTVKSSLPLGKDLLCLRRLGGYR